MVWVTGLDVRGGQSKAYLEPRAEARRRSKSRTTTTAFQKPKAVTPNHPRISASNHALKATKPPQRRTRNTNKATACLGVSPSVEKRAMGLPLLLSYFNTPTGIEKPLRDVGDRTRRLADQSDLGHDRIRRHRVHLQVGRNESGDHGQVVGPAFRCFDCAGLPVEVVEV